MTESSPNRAVLEQFLHAAVSPRPQDMADCYAASVVIEMPFAAEPLYPARIETTREELRARFEAGTALRKYTSMANVVLHQSLDPDVMIAEYDLQGTLVTTGEPFTLSFAMIVTFRDGEIVHSRDYTDPLAGARVLGLLPELIAALDR